MKPILFVTQEDLSEEVSNYLFVVNSPKGFINDTKKADRAIMRRG